MAALLRRELRCQKRLVEKLRSQNGQLQLTKWGLEQKILALHNAMKRSQKNCRSLLTLHFQQVDRLSAAVASGHVSPEAAPSSHR